MTLEPGTTPSRKAALDTGAFVFSDSSGRDSNRLSELVVERPALDADALAARLLHLSTRDLRTPWIGIRARPIGEVRETSTPSAPKAIEDAARALRDACEDAVARTLEGSRCAAVLVGGGIDSSVLLALAVAWARRTGNRAFGVALDFGGPGDDRPHLRTLERALRCDVVRVSPEAAKTHFNLCLEGVDAAPLTWPGAAMEIELLAEARRLGADRALMGVGADQLLDGDPTSLAELAQSGEVRTAWRGAQRLSGFPRPRWPFFDWIVRPVIRKMIPKRVRLLRTLRRSPSLPAWAGPRLATIAREHHQSCLHRELEEDVAPENHEHLIWLRHQEEVASGLPRRDPFLDPSLIQLVESIPPVWLLDGGVRRGLFRSAMQSLVPSSILAREDKAEFAPAFARFLVAAGGFDTLRPLATVDALAERGLAIPSVFRDAFARFARNPIGDDGWETVWPALTIEAFLRSQTTHGRLAR